MARWEARGPVAPTIGDLIDEEVHLNIWCTSCNRQLRMTPMEAADLLGSDCTLTQARDRLRCSWCGRPDRVDVFPCTQDMSAKGLVDAAWNYVRTWPQDPHGHARLVEAKATWEARRPRDTVASMCNAFRLKTPLSEIEREMRDLGLPIHFPDGLPNDWARRSKMTRPTNILPVFRPIDASAPANGLELMHKRWWMVPFFHRGETKAWKAMCTNARAETVATSRTFKGPFERRRCLVPADAYYEWTGEKGEKQRWRFERADGDWWCFAGLWDRAHTTEGVLESFRDHHHNGRGVTVALITYRQPAILGKADFATWLDLSADVASLLEPSAAGTLLTLQA